MDWDLACQAYAKGDFPAPFNDALDEEEDWLRVPEDEDENLEPLGFWNGWFEFNDGLLESAMPVYDRLARDYPVLKDLGLLWSKNLAPEMPKDLPADPEGFLIGAFSPERVGTIRDTLAALDVDGLGKLVGEGISAGAIENFESAGDFERFVKSLASAFERASSRSRGFVVWAG